MKTQEFAEQIKFSIESSDETFLHRGTKSKDGEVLVQIVCTEDIRRSLFPESHLRLVSMLYNTLKKLEGKKVERVVLDTSPNMDETSSEFSPFGNLIRLKVITQP